METKILCSDSEIVVELPGVAPGQLQRINDAFTALLDSKFFTIPSGEITLYIANGFVMKIGIYVEKKARGLDKII